ncbi:MAG: hypothetical protein ACJA2O_003890 [Candidatus Azotimanducaceae bacterium]|jgi:hypothetical protein
MRYSHDSWSIDLPNDWQMEETDDVVSIFHAGGVGTFDVSCFFTEEGDVTIEDIIEFAEVAVYERTNLSYLNGIQAKDIEAHESVFQWWLAAANQLIYATYVCDTADEPSEQLERDQLISSLRSL